MDVMGFIGGIFKPVTELIEHLVPSGDARLQAQGRLLEAQIATASKFMDYERELLAARTDLIKAEALGASWLQRSWRPLTMLAFLGLVICDSFGWLSNPLAPEAWTLLQLGLGGYVAGRTLEKIAPAVTAAVTASKKTDAP